MKKITLLLSLLFLATTVATAQDHAKEVGKDSINWYVAMHSLVVDGILKKNVERKKDPDMVTSFVRMKGGCLKFLNIAENERQKFRDFFSQQYPEVETANNQFIKDNDKQSAKKLVSILLRNEDQFRAILTPAQLEIYKKEFTKPHSVSIEMLNNFYVSDKVYKIFNEYVNN